MECNVNKLNLQKSASSSAVRRQLARASILRSFPAKWSLLTLSVLFRQYTRVSSEANHSQETAIVPACCPGSHDCQLKTAAPPFDPNRAHDILLLLLLFPPSHTSSTKNDLSRTTSPSSRSSHGWLPQRWKSHSHLLLWSSSIGFPSGSTWICNEFCLSLYGLS